MLIFKAGEEIKNKKVDDKPMVIHTKEAEVVKETEPVALPMVAEPQYQYGAEAFEAYMKNAKQEVITVQETKTPEVKNKSR